jgi:hypothetical protein
MNLASGQGPISAISFDDLIDGIKELRSTMSDRVLDCPPGRLLHQLAQSTYSVSA